LRTSQDFLWLNNGITILATNAVISGGKNMMMQDIQVVNGLQTTESIYRHFHAGSTLSSNRALSIKIIVSRDERLRDEIIRATNNQSAIEQAALHATDKVQRDIEQILERHDFYYEQRKNYYRNIGRPLERFVTPMYVAAGYVAVILKQPARAARLKSRFMRDQERYEQVFSDRTPIDVWPRLVALLKAAEGQMLLSKQSQGEPALKTWRSLIALLYASKVCSRISFSASEFCRAIDLNNIDAALMSDCYRFVDEHRRRKGAREASPTFCANVCKDFATLHSLSGVECLAGDYSGRRERDTRWPFPPLHDEFLAQVDMLLSAQPWPRGIHIEVAEKLGVPRIKVQRAIEQLIRSGRRIQQVDGILYDAAGNIIPPWSTSSGSPSQS
jgi:hypothetical protein